MLQTCMNQILDHDGGNNYQIIHMSKRKLERAGLLPRSIFPMAIHPIFDSDSDGEDAMSYSDGDGDDDDDDDDDDDKNDGVVSIGW